MGSQKTSTAEAIYAVLSAALLIILMLGFMVLGASYVRDVQQSLGTSDHESLGMAVGFIMIFGGLMLGSGIATACICFFTRRYVGSDTFDRWQRSYEDGKDKVPFYLRILTGYLLRLMRPRSR